MQVDSCRLRSMQYRLLSILEPEPQKKLPFVCLGFGRGAVVFQRWRLPTTEWKVCKDLSWTVFLLDRVDTDVSVTSSAVSSP